MPWNKPEYRRLSRSFGIPIIRHASLWEADDHLLSVENMAGIERYRRFYYRDIQSIVLWESPRRWIYAAILGLIGIFVLLLALIPMAWFVNLPLLIVAGSFIVPAVMQVTRGPSCNCKITTPVQSVRVPGISRLNTGMQVIQALQPRIEAAQENLPHETDQQSHSDVTAPLD